MKIRLFLPILILAAQSAAGATISISFPKDKPALVMTVPGNMAIDQKTERLIIRSKEGRKTFLEIASVSASDGVRDSDTAKAWMLKKADSLLKQAGVTEGVAAIQEKGQLIPELKIAGHAAFSLRALLLTKVFDDFRIWIFSPDGQRYFYACFQRPHQEDVEEGMMELEMNLSPQWQNDIVETIQPAR
jgi:hypothetical protein